MRKRAAIGLRPAAAYQVTVAAATARSKHAEAERSNRELEQFAAIASHDLREPLRTVTTSTQLLARQSQGQFDAKAEEFLTFIVTGAERMRQRIEALLTLAHIATAGAEFRPTSLTAVWQDVVADEHALRRKGNATSAVISAAVQESVAVQVRFPSHVSKACNETSG